jgi:hypothetical protein
MSQSPLDDRRAIAKRVFDALCEKYPEKYVALIQPRDEPPLQANRPRERQI